MNCSKSSGEVYPPISNKISQLTCKQSKKIKKNKKIRYQKRILNNKNEAKYQGNLIRQSAQEKYDQHEISCQLQNDGQTLGFLQRDVYSSYFKIITIQQQKSDIIFNFLPFSNLSSQELKINFPFYLNLEQYSSFSVGQDVQITPYSSSSPEIAEEIFEFIFNIEEKIIGCNRIVNKAWLKMLGLNSDIIIDFVSKYGYFPFGWITGKQNQNSIFQNIQKSGYINMQMINYNGQQFNAKIFLKSKKELFLKNKYYQRYFIKYIVNREQLNIQNIEENFRNYFGLQHLSQDLAQNFIEYNNKQCGIRFL